jgi:hypothetical protein
VLALRIALLGRIPRLAGFRPALLLIGSLAWILALLTRLVLIALVLVRGLRHSRFSCVEPSNG